MPAMTQSEILESRVAGLISRVATLESQMKKVVKIVERAVPVLEAHLSDQLGTSEANAENYVNTFGR